MLVFSLDGRGKHSLHLCSSGGHLDSVKLLIEHKAELDVVDKYGRSCLHWASVNKHYDVVVALIEAGLFDIKFLPTILSALVTAMSSTLIRVCG